MGVAVGMDALSERAAMMRESVQKSQTISDSIVSILGSFDHRLSALETAMRPTQVRLSLYRSLLFHFIARMHVLPIFRRILDLVIYLCKASRFIFFLLFLFLHFLGDQTELDLVFFPLYLVESLRANGESGFYSLERILFEELMKILTRL